MNLVATCPQCKTVYELDDEDIGHLMECECGAALFACHTRSLDVFNIPCADCGNEHMVKGDDVGSVIELDCGATVRVPDVTLRLPVGDRRLAARASAEWRKRDSVAHQGKANASWSAGDSLTKNSHAAEIGNHEINGGFKKFKNEHIQDNRSGVPDRVLAGSLVGGADSGLASNGAGEVRKPAPPKRAIGPILGFWAVATLLIGAVAMFVLREPPSQRRAKQGHSGKQSPSNKGTQAKKRPELKSGLVIAGAGVKPASDNPGVGIVPASQIISTESGDQGGTAGSNGGYRLPPPTIYALPAKKQPRQRLSIPVPESSFTNLQSAMESVFEKYGRVQKLKEKADASTSQTDFAAYQTALVGAIGQIEQAHHLAVARSAMEEIETIRYFLAFLYLNAGMLPEAAVMGEAVARWGDHAEPSTKDAGMIALAATQEMSEIHWGDVEDLGEVRQMETVASILQERWPDDSQIDLILMNIGYLYEAFNQPQNAIRVYGKVSQSSEHHGAAVLASSMAEWNVLRTQHLATGRAIDGASQKRVSRRLEMGLRLVEKTDKGLNNIHVEARLMLAQMNLLEGNPEKAEDWLTADPPALLSSIRVSADGNDESSLLVDEATVRQLYDILFHARSQQGDTRGATQAIEDLAGLIGGTSDELASRRISILKTTFGKLKRTDGLKKSEFDAAVEMTTDIMKDDAAVPTATVLWLGESWAQLGDHAQLVDKKSSSDQAGHNGMAGDAARIAANLFDIAIKRTDFPGDSLQTAQLRRIELLRRSGEVMQSLKQIEDMLANEPNVFTLQIAAAQCLQQVAVQYGRSSDLLAAIEGPSGFSPIWGWGKLVTTLHGTMYSATGTPRHAEQLALAQYNLFWCRYQLASQIKDAGEKQRQLGEVEKSLAKRVATMDKNSDWYVRYKNLLEQISNPN